MIKFSKALLFRSPLQFMHSLGHEEPQPPLELLLVAAMLEDKYKVEVLDGQEDIGCVVPIDSTYSRAGLSDEVIIERIKTSNPDIIFVSSMWMHQKSMLVYICRKIKESFPDLIIVVGGLMVSADIESFLATKVIDYVISGEGELAALSLMEALNAGDTFPQIPGVAFLQDNQVISVPKEKIVDLDKLPLPAYHLINFEHYKTAFEKKHVENWPFMGVLPTRGCTHKCTFCSLPITFEHVFRHHSVERVIKELKMLKEMGVKEVHFYDAHILNDLEFAKNLFKAMIDENLQLAWLAEAGMAVWQLNQEILELAVKSGMYRLDLPIESASKRVRKTIMDKDLFEVDQIQNIVRIARELGIRRIYGFIMIGNPGETKEDIFASFATLRDLELDYKGVRCAKPFPGTPFYQWSQEAGYLPEDFSWDQLWFEYPVIETQEFDKLFLLSTMYAARAIALMEKNIFSYDEAIAEIEQRWGTEIANKTKITISELQAFYLTWEEDKKI